MKIALTITELYPGGAERCLANLAGFLQNRGHQVGVWQLWPEIAPGQRELVDRLCHQGIEVRSGGAVKAWDFPKVTRWLKKELAAFRPDVVQSFLFHANVATSWATPQGVPLFGGARVRQPEWLRQQIQRRACRRMNRLICVSQSVQRHCIDVEKIPTQKTLVIPNGIVIPNGLEIPSSIEFPNDVDPRTGDSGPLRWSDLSVQHSNSDNHSDQQKAAQRGNNARIEAGQGNPKVAASQSAAECLSDDSKVILFVGRLTEQKGILPLLRESGRFLEHAPNHDLVVIGDGVQSEQARFLVQTHKYRDQIHLVGWQKNPMRWMAQAQCLVLPAIYEGMPNVVLEAMAVGIPTVCFEVDGIRELLGETAISNAQVATPGDFAEFSTKLLSILNDTQLHQECCHQNLSRVQKHFNLHDQLAKYENLYLAAQAEIA